MCTEYEVQKVIWDLCSRRSVIGYEEVALLSGEDKNAHKTKLNEPNCSTLRKAILSRTRAGAEVSFST